MPKNIEPKNHSYTTEKEKILKIGEALVSFKHKYYKLFPKYYWGKPR